MIRHYRTGILTVAATVAAAAVLAGLVPPPRAERAAASLEGRFPPLPAFRLVERSGREVTDADLARRVWVAAFTFTSCRATCPRISTVMKGLQGRLTGTDVLLVNLSVDPERDTPAVLAKYADSFGADPDRWWFLTGQPEQVYKLIRQGFKLAVQALDPSDPEASIMEIAHSNRLVLLDRGNRIVGMYDAESPAEISALQDQARRRARPWIGRLPAVNAALNATSTVLLVAALALVLNGYVRGHIAAMIAALIVSALFLACYLAYHAMIGGGTPFRGSGAVRWLYFTVLISHVVLAAAVVPLVLRTVWFAVRKRYDRHVPIARVTFPIWLYVSVTGVVVYWMLYQLDFAPVSIGP